MRQLIYIALVAIMFTMSACSEKGINPNPSPEHKASPYAISQNQALEEVRMFLENFDADAKSIDRERRVKNIESVTTNQLPATKAVNLPDTLFHIVNFENNEGYAILAADSRIPSTLLAVSPSLLRRF